MACCYGPNIFITNTLDCILHLFVHNFYSLIQFIALTIFIIIVIIFFDSVFAKKSCALKDNLTKINNYYTCTLLLQIANMTIVMLPLFFYLAFWF